MVFVGDEKGKAAAYNKHGNRWDPEQKAENQRQKDDENAFQVIAHVHGSNICDGVKSAEHGHAHRPKQYQLWNGKYLSGIKGANHHFRQQDDCKGDEPYQVSPVFQGQV